MSTFRIIDDIEMTDAPQKMNLTRLLFPTVYNFPPACLTRRASRGAECAEV